MHGVHVMYIVILWGSNLVVITISRGKKSMLTTWESDDVVINFKESLFKCQSNSLSVKWSGL